MTPALQWKISSGDEKSTINQHKSENEASKGLFIY